MNNLVDQMRHHLVIDVVNQVLAENVESCERRHVDGVEDFSLEPHIVCVEDGCWEFRVLDHESI